MGQDKHFEELMDEAGRTAKLVASLKLVEINHADSLLKDPLQKYFFSPEEQGGETFDELQKEYDKFYEIVQHRLDQKESDQQKDPQIDPSVLQKLDKYLDVFDYRVIPEPLPTKQFGKIKPTGKRRVGRSLGGPLVREIFDDEVIQQVLGDKAEHITCDLKRNEIRQVVNLGAGCDTRPYRLDCLGNCIVYMVDQEHVIKQSEQASNEAGAQVSLQSKEGYRFPFKCKDVRRIGCNLYDSNWCSKLMQGGFNQDEPTLWIAEGLFQYLKQEANYRIHKEIYNLSSPGSVAIFEYFTERFVKGFSEFLNHLYPVRAWISAVPEPAFEWFASFGWEVYDEVSVSKASTLYTDKVLEQALLKANFHNEGMVILYK